MNETKNDILLEGIDSFDEEARNTIEIAQSIAELINSLSETRVQKGMSQRQLAEKCGLKQSAIARTENIQNIPRLDTLVRMAKGLDLELTVRPKADITTVYFVPPCLKGYQCCENAFQVSEIRRLAYV